jgi:hypothetical protein
MLPEEYTKGNANDLTDRIGSSIIEYCGEPIWVYTVKGPASPTAVGKITRAFTLPKWEPIDNIPLDDPGLNVTAMPSKLGYLNIDPLTVVSLVRIPMRSKTQGVAPRTALINVITDKYQGYTESPVTVLNNVPSVDFSQAVKRQGVSSPEFLAWSSMVSNYVNSYNWAAMMAKRAFVDAYHNEYPSVTSVAGIEKPHVTAIHRRFIVMQDDFGDRFLLYKGKKVAKFLNDRLRYTPQKAYLSGDVERELNILPV